MKKHGTCEDCQRTKYIVCRGRCDMCYRKLRKTETESKINSLVLGGMCTNGHLLDEDNAAIIKTGKRAGKIRCRRCQLMYQRRWQKREDYQGELLHRRIEGYCSKGLHPLEGENLEISNGTNRCRACRRDNWYRKRYGITLDQYNKMKMEQDNSCAICKGNLGGNGHVDHNHETGQVRGILCSQCNTGIGQFRDSPELLISAARYLTDLQSYL